MSTADPLDAIPQALRDAMLDPARRDQSLVLEGTDVQVRFDPEPGVDQRVQVVEGAQGMVMTMYRPAAGRPAAYPADLPYLAGCGASVLAHPDTPEAPHTVFWWVVDDVQGALAGLRAQSAAAGWVESEGDAPIPGLRMIDFHHPDGRHRMVQVTDLGANGSISLHAQPCG